MNLVEGFSKWFAGPPLTKGRIWFAFIAAVAVDGLQFALGPLGWLVLDDALDVIAMILTSAALGFHMLLLPTFIIELIPPVADVLPTWTGCTAAVVMLRKRSQRQAEPPPIDVVSEVSPVPPSEFPGRKS